MPAPSSPPFPAGPDGAAASRPLCVETARAHFPALRSPPGGSGEPPAYFDGPAGTQVPAACVRAIQAYFECANANTHGLFAASRRTDAVVAAARAGMAAFLGASSASEIVVGPNATTLTYRFSDAIGRTLPPGSEVLVTDLDHDANVAPWLRLRDLGVVVRRVPVRTPECTLDWAVLEGLITSKTRLVAVGYASNFAGTLNPLPAIVDRAHAVGARVWVDAVHYAPHGLTDVRALGADYLVCSAYKFFGPHLGVLWARRPLLEALETPRVRPAPEHPPERFETGTQAHELLAGLLGTFDYLAGLCDDRAPEPPEASDTLLARLTEPARASELRKLLPAAMARIRARELTLSRMLLEGLLGLPGVQLYGLSDPARLGERVPTFAFNLGGRSPEEVCLSLAQEEVFAWAGDHYAWQLAGSLGLRGRGGALRVGALHYNTEREVERLLRVLSRLAAQPSRV